MREFAKTQALRSGVQCGVCSLPPETRKAVEEGHAEGMKCTTISRFLATEGYKIRPNAVSYHFREHPNR